MVSKENSSSLDAEPRRAKWDTLWNGLTLITMLAILASVVVMLVIFNDPKSEVNPFPPPNDPKEVVLPTTAAPTSTSTHTPTTTPTAEIIFIPTETPQAVLSPTIEVLVIPATPSAGQPTQPAMVETSTGKFAFELTAPPQGLSASLYDPNRTCEWMGVAGRVFDKDGRPVKGIRVSVKGYLGFTKIDMLSLSGTALQYGPSGYEFTLATEPVASTQRLTLQLFDQSDLPLSSEVVFDTYAVCESNLILIDFKQVGE